VITFVDSFDSTPIAVHEEGNPDGPPLVLVHGWPDSHVLWESVVELLADRFRIIRYDNRGAGQSGVPKPVAAYTMARFADDFSAVIDEVNPGGPVHVLAHDWGSVGVWEYLKRPEAAMRAASFTSVSGPSTDHYAAFVFSRLARPCRLWQFLRALDLAVRFSYWIPFSVPLIAPALMRAGLARLLQDILTGGTAVTRRCQSDNFDADAANSLKIYRANALRSILRVAPHQVGVPVQLICNSKDPVVRPYGFGDESRWVAKLWRRDLKSGHWAPMSHPRELATAVSELVDYLEGQPAAHGLQGARVRMASA
jgi:pimeloyl-ACP methyl ester carboxylesterase